jgi:hypothetical protein
MFFRPLAVSRGSLGRGFFRRWASVRSGASDTARSLAATSFRMPGSGTKAIALDRVDLTPLPGHAAGPGGDGLLQSGMGVAENIVP